LVSDRCDGVSASHFPITSLRPRTTEVSGSPSIAVPCLGNFGNSLLVIGNSDFFGVEVGTPDKYLWRTPQDWIIYLLVIPKNNCTIL
jgi:hypothetical protein